MATKVAVRMDAVAIQKLLASEAGPVMRHAAVVAEGIKQGAQAQVGYSAPAQSFARSGQARHLRDSIVKRFIPGSGGASIWVGSVLPHALLHHEGTAPHVIVPRKAKALRFPSRGGVVFAKRVNHPGTKGTFYLTRAAQQLGLRVRVLGMGRR